MWGQFSAMTGSLHDSIHPPEMEINPPRMACGCPCGGVIKQPHSNPRTLWNAWVSVQLHWLCDRYSVQLGRLQLSPWSPGCWSLGWTCHGEAAAIAMVTRVLKSWLGVPNMSRNWRRRVNIENQNNTTESNLDAFFKKIIAFWWQKVVTTGFLFFLSFLFLFLFSLLFLLVCCFFALCTRTFCVCMLRLKMIHLVKVLGSVWLVCWF